MSFQNTFRLRRGKEAEMIEVKHLTKQYGNFTAVKDISFSVKKDEILGFLGPNGAEKSTTMNIITGYISSSEGTVTINGYDILEEPNKAKAQIGYLPEQPPLYTNMTVTEYLTFVCRLKKIKDKKEQEKQIARACTMSGIGHVRDRIIDHLSKGYRQRIGIAQALLGEPPVLILDEPTSGLDPAQIVEIRELIRSLSKHHTVILSSHILSEIQATCDRIIIISQGQIAADDTAEHLSKSMNEKSGYLLDVEGEQQAILNALDPIAANTDIRMLPSEKSGLQRFSIISKDGSDPRRTVFELLAEAHLPIFMLKSNALTLEEIFLKLISENIEEKQKALDENDLEQPKQDSTKRLEQNTEGGASK